MRLTRPRCYRWLAVVLCVALEATSGLARQSAGDVTARWRDVLRQPVPQGKHAAAREELAKRQARAAVELLRLGHADDLWPLLRHDTDPTRRSYLIRDIGRAGVSAELLVRRLRTETDVAARRAVILMLGEFDDRAVNVALRAEAISQLRQLYQSDPDPGMHSAIEWLLRHDRQGLSERRLAWNARSEVESLDRELRSNTRPPGRQWFVTAEGHTMAVVSGPVEFTMGSPEYETYRPKGPDEMQLRVRIPRSFAVATKEVTVAQFQRFLDAHPAVRRAAQADPSRDPSRESPTMRRASPDDDSPQVTITWFEAAQYCNWLSRQDGIPEDQWVYPPLDRIKEGMALPQGHMHRTGYRLPTDAEWEFAARAGASAPRFFGTSEELLREYAWYAGNTFAERSWPVGQLKPNDFGLFDMYGNVWEWIHDLAKSNGQTAPATVRVDDEDDVLTVSAKHPRPRRGGSYSYDASFLRSAHRGSYIPDERRDSVGFRIARTVQ